MYQTIKNPLTDRNISIYGKKGRELLARYIDTFQRGGAKCKGLRLNPCKKELDCNWGVPVGGKKPNKCYEVSKPKLEVTPIDKKPSFYLYDNKLSITDKECKKLRMKPCKDTVGCTWGKPPGTTKNRCHIYPSTLTSSVSGLKDSQRKELVPARKEIESINPKILTKQLYTILTNQDISTNKRNNEVLSLLEIGAEPDGYKDTDYGSTPLLWASSLGYYFIIENLLKYGADINFKNNVGNSALIYACTLGYDNIVSLLLSYKPELNLLGEKGIPPLLEAIEKGYYKITVSLLKNGAIVNIEDKDGWNGIMIAAIRGDIKMMKLLIKHDINVNHRDNTGGSALLHVSNEGDTEIVDILIRHGADTDFQDKDGWSALMMASSSSNYDIVSKLLEYGADVNLINNNGKSALDFAISRENNEVISILKSYGAYKGSLIEFSKYKDLGKETLKKYGYIRNYHEYIEKWISIQNIGNHNFNEERRFLLPKKDDICMKQQIDKSKLTPNIYPPNTEWPIKYQCILPKKYNQKSAQKVKVYQESCEESVPIKSSETKEKDFLTKCELYYSTSKRECLCVDKNRIRNFRGSELATEINTAGGKFKFNLLDTIPIMREKWRKGQKSIVMKENLHCQVLFSYDPTKQEGLRKQLYILSAIGNVDVDIWHPEYEEQFKKIYNQYIYFSEEYDKLILCGHSMGAVLSLRIGYYIWVHNPELFNEKCIVLGTCPYKWRPSMDDIDYNIKYTEESMIEYEDKKNVVIFYAAVSILPGYKDYPRKKKWKLRADKAILATINDSFMNEPIGLRKNYPGLYLSIIPEEDSVNWRTMLLLKSLPTYRGKNDEQILTSTEDSIAIINKTASSSEVVDDENLYDIWKSDDNLHDWLNYSSRLIYLLDII